MTRKLHTREQQYDCMICGAVKGTYCIITKGKNKGNIASAYHEWGRRNPPVAIKAMTLKDIIK